MSDLTTVELTRLPANLFKRSFSFLEDVLRECQLVLVNHAVEEQGDPELVALAQQLVPTVEGVLAVARASEVSEDGDRVDVVSQVPTGAGDAIAGFESLLSRLAIFGDRGELLIEVDEAMTRFQGWIWREVVSQLDGRARQVYPGADD